MPWGTTHGTVFWGGEGEGGREAAPLPDCSLPSFGGLSWVPDYGTAEPEQSAVAGALQISSAFLACLEREKAAAAATRAGTSGRSWLEGMRYKTLLKIVPL